MDKIKTKLHPTLPIKVDSEGNIFQSGELLKPFLSKSILYFKYLDKNPRYPKTSSKEFIYKTRSVKVAIWEAFSSKPIDNQILGHLDKDPLNCSISNLFLTDDPFNATSWKQFLSKDSWRKIPNIKPDHWISRAKNILDDEGKELFPDKNGVVIINEENLLIDDLYIQTWLK